MRFILTYDERRNPVAKPFRLIACIGAADMAGHLPGSFLTATDLDRVDHACVTVVFGNVHIDPLPLVAAAIGAR